MERGPYGFNRAIRSARAKTGMTQELAASRMGISSEFYGRLERGQAAPSVVTLAKIVQVLGVSADVLLAEARTSYIPEREERNPQIHRIIAELRNAPSSVVRLVTLLLIELRSAGASASEVEMSHEH